MDGLFGIIWVLFIAITLSNALSGKNKKAQKKKQTSIPPVTAKPVTQQPAPAKAEEPIRRPIEKLFTEPAPAETAVPAQPVPAAPRVHTHLAPDCDIDGPSGSMDYVSTEGVDPCHDDDLPSRAAPRPGFTAPREQPGLALEWTGDALVKSVIMQEVLTRPCQRRR